MREADGSASNLQGVRACLNPMFATYCKFTCATITRARGLPSTCWIE